MAIKRVCGDGEKKKSTKERVNECGVDLLNLLNLLSRNWDGLI